MINKPPRIKTIGPAQGGNGLFTASLHPPIKSGFSRSLNKKGFSLIEVLVVLSIFVLIAIIANQLLFPVFRGSEKTGAAIIVKQNGNYAISVIQRELYNSKGVFDCAANRVTYFDADGELTSISCSIGSGSKIFLASRSGARDLTSSEVEVESCTITCPPPSPPYKQVGIEFTLKKAGAVRVEEKASFDFRTSVTLRN